MRPKTSKILFVTFVVMILALVVLSGCKSAKRDFEKKIDNGTLSAADAKKEEAKRTCEGLEACGAAGSCTKGTFRGDCDAATEMCNCADSKNCICNSHETTDGVAKCTSWSCDVITTTALDINTSEYADLGSGDYSFKPDKNYNLRAGQKYNIVMGNDKVLFQPDTSPSIYSSVTYYLTKNADGTYKLGTTPP